MHAWYNDSQHTDTHESLFVDMNNDLIKNPSSHNNKETVAKINFSLLIIRAYY